jgi:tryptophan-rich sensory protein
LALETVGAIRNGAKHMDWTSILVGLGFLAAVFAAGVSGAVFRPGEWYERLDKPAWTPPNWLFPVAWTVLYLMIAASGWLVWRAVGFDGAPLAFAVYGVQLVLNFGWSAVFFGLRLKGLALLEVSALLASIVATIALFWPISELAAWLMVPYALWVTFAMALNANIWARNRGAAATA